MSYEESLNSGKQKIFLTASYIQGQWKYGKAKEAVESARAGLSPQKGDVRKSRKEKKKKRPWKARRWLQRRQGSVCPKPRIPFFWFTSIWVLKRPISVEESAPTTHGLRGSNVRRKFWKRTTLRSESSTLKGLLYAPIQQKQYHKRTTLRRLKILLRSIVARKVPNRLGAKREESCHETCDVCHLWHGYVENPAAKHS